MIVSDCLHLHIFYLLLLSVIAQMTFSGLANKLSKFIFRKLQYIFFVSRVSIKCQFIMRSTRIRINNTKYNWDFRYNSSN